MSEPIWNKFLTERDKQVFAAAGYGARAGFGKRPGSLHPNLQKMRRKRLPRTENPGTENCPPGSR